MSSFVISFHKLDRPVGSLMALPDNLFWLLKIIDAVCNSFKVREATDSAANHRERRPPVSSPEPTVRDARTALGVNAAASPAEVVSAYRRLAKTVHPDVSDDKDAAARFIALAAAYRVALDAADRPSGGVVTSETSDRDAISLDSLIGLPHDLVRDYLATRRTVISEGGHPVMVVGPATMRPSQVRRSRGSCDHGPEAG